MKKTVTKKTVMRPFHGGPKFAKTEWWIDRLTHNIADKDKFKMEFGQWMAHREALKYFIEQDFRTMDIGDLVLKYKESIR